MHQFKRFFSSFPALRRAPAGGRALATLSAVLLAMGGCDSSSSSRRPVNKVIVYTSVDEPFARGILAEFERASGLRVESLFDTEGGKTTGFVRRLEREKVNPLCDVWWSSEVFGTVELARRGVLSPYESPAAADIPSRWKDGAHRWTGLAARARVLAFDTRKFKAGDLPQTWRALSEPALLGRFAYANPQFGTTRGHVAAMFAFWGVDPATKYLQLLRDSHALIADGNGHAVRLVASGAADLCMTDTDDVWVAQGRGEPIDLIYPRLDDGLPPLWIPCSVALVAGGPNPEGAKKLIDFLVSAQAERLLAASDSRNVPVRPELFDELKMNSLRPEPLDFDRIADALPEAMNAAREILLR